MLKQNKTTQGKIDARDAYKILVDCGKPYEIEVLVADILKAELKKIYEEVKDGDYAFCDVKVFNEKDEDISESQFIEEMIGEIMDNDDGESQRDERRR